MLFHRLSQSERARGWPRVRERKSVCVCLVGELRVPACVLGVLISCAAT